MSERSKRRAMTAVAVGFAVVAALLNRDAAPWVLCMGAVMLAYHVLTERVRGR